MKSSNYSRTSAFSNCALLVVPLLALALAHCAHAEPWQEWRELQGTLKATLETDPAAAAQALEQFQQEQGDLGEMLGPIVAAQQGDITLKNLKQPEAALQIYNEGLAKYKDKPGAVVLLTGKAQVLKGQGKNEEIIALFEEQWPLIVQAGRRHNGHYIYSAWRSLEPYAEALEAKTKEPGLSAEQKKQRMVAQSDALTKVLVEMPIYLNNSMQGVDNGWLEGWIYEGLIQSLLDQGRKQEALGWAKVMYVTGAFSESSIKKSTAQLSKTWAQNDEFGAMRAFARAQDPLLVDATVANPLAKIEMPTTQDPIAKALRTRLQQVMIELPQADPESRKFLNDEAVSIALALNDVAEVRDVTEFSRSYLRSFPESPVGPQFILRALKGVDLNTLRANAFISFLNGEGPDPLPGFLQGKPAVK